RKRQDSLQGSASTAPRVPGALCLESAPARATMRIAPFDHRLVPAGPSATGAQGRPEGKRGKHAPNGNPSGWAIGARNGGDGAGRPLTVLCHHAIRWWQIVSRNEIGIVALNGGALMPRNGGTARAAAHGAEGRSVAAARGGGRRRGRALPDPEPPLHEGRLGCQFRGR